ncbi:MAG: biotin transporter BioY, partial [Phycisphaerae bacterium]|nr:biotin transporter BioY [Phycisphaerae bacterium]
NIRSTVLTSLFAALIAAGAYISVPIGPVPITLQTFFILTAGILGGRKIGVSAVFIYLVAGALGLPVFSGGTGSIAHFFGPTGGYLLAALPAVYITGMFSEFGAKLYHVLNDQKSQMMRSVIIQTSLVTAGALLGSLIFYCIGVPWLKIVLKIDWVKAYSFGMGPFLIGDAIKMIAAISLGSIFCGRVYNFLHFGAANEPT